MATRPKAVIESRNGEKFSPITIAKNVLTDDGQNLHDILSDRKEDMMTPTIENSSSMSKVGQGDNVDYSENVVDGAYESMVLKGKSMVNYIQEPSSQDVVLPYEFEECQYVTINDTKESGALGVELKGQTLVNLIPEGRQSSFHLNNTHGGGQAFWDSPNVNMIKPSTKYLILTNVTLNTGSRIVINNNEGYISCFTDGIYYEPNEVGIKKTILTSKSDLSDCTTILRSYTHTVGEVKGTIQVFEYQEGMENCDIPYFTGMASCKMPILHSINQMFDYSCATKPTNTGTISFANDGRTLKTNFEVTRDCVNVTNITLPVGTYNISYKIRGSVTLPEGASLSSSRAGLALFRSSEVWFNCIGALMANYATMDSVNYTKVTKTFTFDEPVTVTVVYHGWNNSPVGWCELTDIRIVPQGKSSILSLPEEVVLRSLPNGVCDTFNTRTGVYTQRIGEVVLNGSESWNPNNTEGTTTQRFFCNMLTNSAVENSRGTQQYLCDRLRTIVWNQTCELGLTVNGSGVFVYNNAIEYSASSVKQWLSQNPVRLQYELATPIITKINLPSTLKSWNTTTHIYSEIPENTLYPILSHSNPTYPVIIKPSTKYSIVANSYSNGHTNSAINFNLGGATVSTTVGNRVTTITTPSTLSNELLTMSGRGNKLNNVMVIEGDVAGDEPYFEGICDCKSPILSNVGKNLCNVNRYMLACGSGVALNGYKGTVIAKNIKVKPNTTYTFSYGNTVNIPSSVQLKVMTLTDVVDEDIHVDVYSHKNRIYEHSVPNGGSFTTEGGTRYIAITTGNLTTTGDILIEDIEIKEATSPTAYEPYKSNTTTFTSNDDEIIVLRSSSNGVCDTLNVNTGEYVQRVKEVVYTGEENWGTMKAPMSPNNIAFHLPLDNHLDNTNNSTMRELVKDNLGFTNNCLSATINEPSLDGKKGFSIHNNGNVYFTIPTSECANLDAWKSRLRTQPLVLQYPVKNPIVKQINVEGYPYAYENGHVLLESGSQEQSLTPTIEYSIVANRGGQIRSNQRMVERHQKQLDRLQAMILTNLVNTQYEQALTNLKYDLKNVREEVK